MTYCVLYSIKNHIYSIHQGICDNLTFPFPGNINDEEEFIRFTKRMNRMLPTLCIDLGM